MMVRRSTRQTKPSAKRSAAQALASPAKKSQASPRTPSKQPSKKSTPPSIKKKPAVKRKPGRVTELTQRLSSVQAALTKRQEMLKDLFDETFDDETDEDDEEKVEEEQQERIELSSDDDEEEPVHESEVEDDESEDEESEDEESEDDESEEDESEDGIVEEEETTEEDDDEDQNLVIEEGTMDAMDVDLCNIPTVAPPSSDDEPKVLFGETQVRLNEHTLSQDCGIAVFPSDDPHCGFDRLQQAIESGILTKHAWKNGGFVVEVRGVFDHFYPVRRSGDNTKGYRLSSDYMRKTMHNDVEQIKIDIDSTLSEHLNLTIQVPRQELVQMTFQFIFNPPFLAKKNQWIMTGDHWAIGDFQWMIQEIGSPENVRIEGKKTKQLWHLHAKFKSKQQVIDGPAQALLKKCKHYKNLKIKVIL
jgi:hypothetical protein